MVYLSEEKRKDITVSELARFIFRLGKEEKVAFTNIPALLQSLCPENKSNIDINGHSNKEFSIKFHEAITLLKRQGLLMDVISFISAGIPIPAVYPTSIWEKSSLDGDGIIILIDDAQDIVNSLKHEATNLDPVVEQYYLESLRACQDGLYISSVICLGAASERTIDCLKEAIVKYDQTHKKLENKWVSESIKHILDNFNQIFGSAIDRLLKDDLKEQLGLTEGIYRLNRNSAGHPKAISMNITRCEQENYLNSFRRFASTIFKVISRLSSNP
ncbi:MAG: hypothetical protein AAB116_18470 [Candidatus Poribacteria bacterium]